jgi:predicted transcriptional regulator
MSFLGIGKKDAEKDRDFSRIEAEDMIDQNYTCKEIAEELGTTEETVYRIKQAKGRRDARKGQKGLSDFGIENPVVKAKQELEAARLDFERQKLSFEMEKLKAEQEDYFGYDDDVVEKADNPLEAMAMSFFMNKMSGGVTQPPPQPIKPVETPIIKPDTEQPQQTERELEVMRIINLIPVTFINQIKAGTLSEKTCLKYASAQGIEEDLAREAYKKIRGE